jgi:hypothetical protein
VSSDPSDVAAGSSNPPPSAPVGGSKKKRNDNSNNSFKKSCKKIRKMVKKYLKVKKNPYEGKYGSKCYFLLSLLLLEQEFTI